jgi:hypothetical protein
MTSSGLDIFKVNYREMYLKHIEKVEPIENRKIEDSQKSEAHREAINSEALIIDHKTRCEPRHTDGANMDLYRVGMLHRLWTLIAFLDPCSRSTWRSTLGSAIRYISRVRLVKIVVSRRRTQPCFFGVGTSTWCNKCAV